MRLSTTVLAGFAKRLRGGGDYASCRQCGACCERWGGTLLASESDVAAWKSEGREDLLSRVGPMGEIWLDPSTGIREKRCPYLSRASSGLAACLINGQKPLMCRQYPGPVQSFRCIGKVRFPLHPYWTADRVTLA
ncbi:YkgJ family cysteine cluster protein [bacterium]|nr:MAG: YkgJ family cysteine cluster protein [bacterium]